MQLKNYHYCCANEKYKLPLSKEFFDTKHTSISCYINSESRFQL